MDIYDVTIIGAGPTGLFAAFYAGLREMRSKIIESLPEVGGQVITLYPEKYIYDIAGIKKILGKDLIKDLYEQSITFSPTFCLNETASIIRHLPNGIIEIESDKGKHFTKTLIITAGIGAFSPNKLNVLGLEKFEGKGVSYAIRDKTSLKGKSVLIIGGGNSAVDWALNLDGWCKKVTLIHRRDGFRALERSLAELSSSNVEVKPFYELKEVNGNNKVEEAIICDNRTKEETTLPVSSILIFVGYKANLGAIKNWGLKIDGRHIKVDAKMRTNLPGVFAAGDLSSQYDGVKLNLIAMGFAEAAIAVSQAKKILDPLAPTFEHSTEKGIKL